MVSAPRYPNKTLEKAYQKAILDYLKLRRIFAWKNNNVGIRKPNGSFIPPAMRGVSDILGVLPDGRFLAIEIKKPGEKPTPDQALFLENIKFRGGVSFVATYIDDVEKHLDGP